jgi:hypothetical protein
MGNVYHSRQLCEPHLSVLEQDLDGGIADLGGRSEYFGNWPATFV